MNDTWGHLFPKPGEKYPGKMLLGYSQYGALVILKSEFPGLPSSPQRYQLEHTIFDAIGTKLGIGVWMVECTLWFYKNASGVGKIIGIKGPVLCETF